jgi:hypothetical protein
VRLLYFVRPEVDSFIREYFGFQVTPLNKNSRWRLRQTLSYKYGLRKEKKRKEKKRKEKKRKEKKRKEKNRKEKKRKE